MNHLDLKSCKGRALKVACGQLPATAAALPQQDTPASSSLPLTDSAGSSVSTSAEGSRLATREDAEAFIKTHLDSAEWKGKSLMVSFEKEALIHALVEHWTFKVESPVVVSAPEPSGTKQCPDCGAESCCKEVGRWQEAIRNRLIQLGAPEHLIDGGACDSGDPLDLTLTEINQAFNYFEESKDAV